MKAQQIADNLKNELHHIDLSSVETFKAYMYRACELSMYDESILTFDQQTELMTSGKCEWINEVYMVLTKKENDDSCVFLVNPWSKSEVKITNDEALKRIDDCVNEFGTDAEKYIIEGIDGVEAINSLIENSGINRTSDIWFS